MVSTVLAVATIVIGLASINALEHSDSPDMVIEVDAEQWKWHYTYVDYDLLIDDAEELVLPIGRLIEFRVTSRTYCTRSGYRASGRRSMPCPAG